MQSSISHRDNLNNSLGERRGKSDLARFSLDLNWTRAAPDSPRSRAYPSPPMSGSPPLPPRHNPEPSDRGHGGFVSSGQDVYRGPQASQLDHSQHSVQQHRGYPAQQMPLPPYVPFRTDMPMGQIQYQPQQMTQQIPQQQHQRIGYSQHPQHAQHPQQNPAPFTGPERDPIGDAPDFSSPKQQRKTKGHVASACVPCKRAHLRCDAQRPCSRCLSNGKEEACIDVQHKKRGRPRLRDERETRYDSLGSGYPHPPGSSMRRPVYTQGNSSINNQFSDPLQRSGSYRVLKSQGPGTMNGPIAPRFVDHAMMQDPSVYGAPMQPAPRVHSMLEPVCAYLNMEMQIAKSSQTFGETVGLQNVVSRKLLDLVVGSDSEKVHRLQRAFDEERREKEPNYLPPIYLKYEEDRVIQSVGFGPDEMGQLRVDRQEIFTFQGMDGQSRSFQVGMGLAKKESTYFIAFLLTAPSPQAFQPPPPSPYPRDVYARNSQYGYQIPPQGYMSAQAGQVYGAPPPGYDTGMSGFRSSGTLGSNMTASTGMSTYTQPPQRQDLPQAPPPYQIPRSELPPGHGQQSQRQRDLQLPPIRDQRNEADLIDPAHRRDDRSGRVDIGGLIEIPGMSRKGV